MPTVFVALALLIAAALIYGNHRWTTASKKIIARLESARLPAIQATYNPDELTSLPAPVQAYLRTVLTPGQPIVTAVSIAQIGSMNMSTTGESWKPFTSKQRIIPRRPGFDWEARMQMFPGLAARVHDAYIAGEGLLHASLWGLFSMADASGTPELAQGELLRFFAEAAWYPTAYLPSQGVVWNAIDEHSAEAILHDGALAVTLLFRFGKDNLIESMYAASRGCGVGPDIVPTPWQGHWSNYQKRHGMLIPLDGEVAWVMPDGPKTYWRGQITKIDFEFVG